MKTREVTIINQGLEDEMVNITSHFNNAFHVNIVFFIEPLNIFVS